MKPLHEILAALKAEIAKAGEESSRARIQAELQCTFGTDATGAIHCLVLTEEDRASDHNVHSITVKLSVGAPRQRAERRQQSNPESAKPVETPSTASQDPALIEALAAIFGPPGFDNAARTSVFREILEELTAPQLEALFDSFRTDPAEVPLVRLTDTSVAMARTRLTRLLKLGPAGLAGVRAMLRLLEEHSLRSVLDVLARVWKTQEDWVDTTPPGVKLE